MAKPYLSTCTLPKKQALTKNQRRNSYIHGIPQVAIESGYNQVLWRSDGRGRTESLNCKPGKGIQQQWKAGTDHQTRQLSAERPSPAGAAPYATGQSNREKDSDATGRNDQEGLPTRE